MAGYDPWASTNAGLVNLGSNIANINNRRIADSENQRRNSLADLQIQQTKTAMEEDAQNAPLRAKQREATMISLDDQLEQYKAKVEAGGGSAEEYYKGQQTLTKMKKLGEIVKQNIRNLPQVWPQIVAAFPEMKDVDPTQFQQTADGIAHPFKTPDGQVVPNTYYIYDNDGKMVIKEVKPDAEAMLDKRLAFQSEQTRQQIEAADRRSERQIAASDRKAEKGASSVIGKMDAEAVKGSIKTLPTLKQEATMANNSISRIDTMVGLIDKGVGGKRGQIAAALAPYAEAAGINSRFMSDAKFYATLAKTIGGSMRMEIVGPGPVSNFENQLLQQISGGGSAGSAAAKQLLNYYKEVASGKVASYNETVESVGQYSPAAVKIYKKIGGSNATTSTGNRPLPKF